ncbi:NAD(P)-dependent oxidoreductase [Myroides sp. LJL110]
MQTLGWIGLGHMGTPMAVNLLKAKKKVNLFVRDPNKASLAIDMGGSPISDFAAFIEKTQVVFITLPNDQICLETFEKMRDLDLVSKTFINCSTISPECSKELSQLVSDKKGIYLEAPVSGSVKPATDGTLMFLVSGQEKDYQDNLPYFEILGSCSFYLGQNQGASKAKLAINYYMSVVVQGFAETMLFAKSQGIDPLIMSQIVNQGACGSGMTKIKTPSVLQDQYPSAFPLKFMLKDLNLAQDLGWNTALLQTIKQSYQGAEESGLGDKDLMAVIKAIQST